MATIIAACGAEPVEQESYAHEDEPMMHDYSTHEEAIAQSDGSAAGDAAAAAAVAAVAQSATPEISPTPPRFTKAQFDNYVYGMTKAEVRRRFGSPASVDDASGTWFYHDLPIYDADAGIQVGVWIRFMGIGGPADEVAAVSF